MRLHNLGMPFLPLLACVGLFSGTAPHRLQDAAQWPAQLDDPGWKPRIGYLRQATGIAGQVLVGPKLRWDGPGQVKWSLLNAPDGMRVNASNKIQWPVPIAGRYLVRVQAQADAETEEAGWLVNVVKADFPNPVVYSTRHMDYVVPESYAGWLDRAGAMRVIDAYYEFGRDLVGALPCDARQSILWDPSVGGAYSGIPIHAGPGAFGDNDANHWKLGFLFHELGHNLNGSIRVEYLEEGDKFLDTCLHGMVEFEKIAWVCRMLKDPDKQGVPDVPKFAEWMKAESMEFVDGYQNYIKDVATGADLLTWTKGQSVAWAGMLHEYTFKYGSEATEKCLRALRRDGIALGDYPENKNSTDRLTILECIMSNAAGRDLRDDFKAMKIPLNDKVYARFNAVVANTMQHLPALGKNGAVLCPADGHYYCMTPYHMTWAEAEATARRLGGHLATIRSAAQEQWLANKYGRNGWMWVGLRKGSNGIWNWVTRETTGPAVWEPERPESDPAKTCAVLILHEDALKPIQGWFGLANRPPDEQLIGIVELDHAPTTDTDALP